MADWRLIVFEGYESKAMDYKGPCAWSEKDKKACCEIVKDILALANTDGGYLVFGVSEMASGFERNGLSPEQAATFDTTRVNNFLQPYADPPVNTKIIKQEYEGKVFVILEVPRFPDTPHICQKDFPGVLSVPVIYVRTDNNESAPLRSSSDMRGIIEAAVRNRSDQLLTTFRTILTQGVQEDRPDDESLYGVQITDAIRSCAQVNPHEAKGYGYRNRSRFFRFSQGEASIVR